MVLLIWRLIQAVAMSVFKSSYAENVQEAYEKECRNYHDFGGDRGKLRKTVHPAKSEDYKGNCPVCHK